MKITVYNPYPAILFWVLVILALSLGFLILSDLYKINRLETEMQYKSDMVSNFFAIEKDNIKAERDSLQVLLNKCIKK